MFLNQTTYLSLPDEPVVRMKELGAVQYAYLLLKKRNWATGEDIFEPWIYIIHFFYSQGEEIGYWNGPCECLHEFEKPREWFKQQMKFEVFDPRPQHQRCHP